MKLEPQRIGTSCVALLLGGSVSLSLFLLMIFLIEPERAINSHISRPYRVTLVSVERKSKMKKVADKSIAMPKLSSNPLPTPTRIHVLPKVTPENTLVRLPGIGSMNAYGPGQSNSLNLATGPEEEYYPEDNRKVRFNRVEKRYLHSEAEKAIPRERVRIPGGGEIDRIGNSCFETSGVDGAGNSGTGQTAVEKDLNRSLAMNSLAAHRVPCNKAGSTFVQDFLKRLEIRGLITAPASVTN